MRVYLDAAPIIYVVDIYVVEQNPDYSEILDRRFSDPGVILLTSDMSRLECRVKPLRERNMGLLVDFNQFFEHVFAVETVA